MVERCSRFIPPLVLPPLPFQHPEEPSFVDEGEGEVKGEGGEGEG